MSDLTKQTSADPSTVERVEITINGRTVQARTDKPLIQACVQAEVEVPHYCYHPGLTPEGSCRICQVEVQQGKIPARVMVACRTPVVPGMVVNTETEDAHDARRECLEFLLKNHPLDCPICDKAGECTLHAPRRTPPTPSSARASAAARAAPGRTARRRASRSLGFGRANLRRSSSGGRSPRRRSSSAAAEPPRH